MSPAAVAALDAWASDNSTILTDDELRVIRRWQGTDRYYVEIQAHLRGSATTTSDEVRDDAETLQAMLLRRELAMPTRVTAWRGIRSRARMFSSSPGLLPRESETLVVAGLMAMTVHREVAETEFAAPEGPGGSALFQIEIPRGVRGLWLPALGDPSLAYQGELLLNEYTQLVVRQVEAAGGRPLIHLEVTS